MIQALDDKSLRQDLRRELRARRQALSPQEQQQASLKLIRQLTTLPQFLRAQHIALYLSNDGEINPAALAQQIWKMGKQTYLPVVRPDKPQDMWFVEYRATSVLTPNRFGILEPDFRSNRRIAPHFLDMVLMPLVGFDRQGARLGMGGGFYDRCFAFKQKKPDGRPYLIGLAHQCQEVDSLVNAAWDIPMFGIATDKEFIRP